ncbi:MAG TPA: cyclopropane-fatty-acyl-phospholipid synthase family protein [Pelomicrobium sp.]|nr:cyclopropane-fatty-acyl-phospholipid synthase family protein [Pelomicrobium sp.]
MSSTTHSLPPLGSDTPMAARLVSAALSRMRCGSIGLTLPDGRSHTFRGPAAGPHGEIAVADWRCLGLLVRSGDIGFAEGYIRGYWTTPDLTRLIEVAALNMDDIEATLSGKGWMRALYRLRHWLRPNTRRGSRRNIHRHYDLGNDFYGRWLDPSMTYSSAVFDGDLQRSLEDAQRAKYERILARLDPAEGDTILEIGCGWGGFAEYAARTRGCRVHGITVSREQLDYARARIERAGLKDRVQLEFRDYRDLDGEHDHIVSIEMFEAVGERYWPTFFRTLGRSLRRGGRAVVQTITIASHRFEQYRRTPDFIQQYVFPGGMLPSPAVFGAEVRAAGLAVRSVYSFGPDYAETLRRWREAFNAAAADVERLGFDARFQRIWNYYLAYCEAGFRTRNTDVMQVEIALP